MVEVIGQTHYQEKIFIAIWGPQAIRGRYLGGIKPAWDDPNLHGLHRHPLLRAPRTKMEVLAVETLR